jgi:type IV pilus assembly protein PilN
MKIPINLASQPFRRDRPMLVASLAISLLLIGTLGVLIALYMTDRSQLGGINNELSHLKRGRTAVTGEQARLDGILRQPQNAFVLDRSLFINTLIFQKSISWSRLFEDLEQTVPYNVKIMALHPVVKARNQVTLDMQAGAQEFGPLIELLKALETSPVFGKVSQPTWQPPTQAEPFFRIRVTVNYVQKL